MYSSILGSEQLGSSLVAKCLWVLMATKLSRRQQCALVARKAKSLMGCIRHSPASRARGAILALCPSW